MRSLVLFACVLFLCGCVSKEQAQPAAEIPTKVIFSDDFSSGNMSGWRFQTTGGGAISAQDHPTFKVKSAAEMTSSGFRSAVAQAPHFTMDWGGDYDVSFNFMLLHRDNFGYTVYQDRNVYLSLDQATGISCVQPTKRRFLGRFDTNVWSRILVKVRPQEGEYDVSLNDEPKGTCDIMKSDTQTFLLGDSDPTDVIYGDGLWDDFKITE